ncbi:MAG TPA: S53 family peptidase [Solirubrobacteraceae bacterium]|nr:S53 family peptidase [Solirubrobacteraceae bacterium]
MSLPVKLVPAAAVGAVATLALAQSAAAFAPAGSTSLRTRDSSDQGAVTQTRTVTLTLAPRDAAGLRAFDAQPGHALLTPTQFAARFAPSQASVAAVESWAAAHGLQVASVSPDRLLVQLSGSPTALGSALGVVFDRFRAADGSSYVSSTGTASLPVSLAATVTAISGLSDLSRAQLDIARRSGAATPGLSIPASYGPQELSSLYDASSSQTGAGQTVSVIAEGDLSQPKRDLAQFESRFGLPAVTWNQIDVGKTSSDTEGDDEWDLDTQYSTGFAPGVNQVNVYVGSSLEDEDILATVDRWVTDDSSSQASFSAGECELLAKASGFTESLDTVLAEAAAQGQTLFTSSGDTGSQCPLLIGLNGLPLGLPGVNYPASSPSAIGVGGTTVLGEGPNEIGWYAGGGGTSAIEATPSWQQNAGGSFLGLQRGVPDVALDADPNSGYDVIVNGEEEVIGGTSASAPSWQGIWARAQGAHGGTLGFAGPVIYATEPEAAFDDITLGANGLFADTPGWDYVTGRGTPDIAAFVAGA